MGIAKEQGSRWNKVSMACNTTFLTRAWKSVGIFSCGRTAHWKKLHADIPRNPYVCIVIMTVIAKLQTICLKAVSQSSASQKFDHLSVTKSVNRSTIALIKLCQEVGCKDNPSIHPRSVFSPSICSTYWIMNHWSLLQHWLTPALMLTESPNKSISQIT